MDHKQQSVGSDDLSENLANVIADDLFLVMLDH
jgi:hypothetical protein